MITHTVFEKVNHYAVKSLPCPKCGKKLRRQQTFWATLNPWNNNDDGSPRTRAQIRDRLREKAATWMAEPEWHSKCQEADQ